MKVTAETKTDSTKSQEQQQLAQLTELAKIAYAGRIKAKEGQAEETKAVGEVLRQAVELGASRKTITLAFMNAGYSQRTAASYASTVNSVQRDPEVKEQVLAREVSFSAGAQAARDNKKAEDPEKATEMLRACIDKASKWAIINELSQEDFVNRCTLGYIRAKARQDNKKN